MKTLLKKYKLYLIGAVLGGAIGWLYYYFIGCTSGSCGISSRPLHSTVFFGMMGMVIFGMFEQDTHPANKEKD